MSLQPYSQGTMILPDLVQGGHYALLWWVLNTYKPEGLALEFGVGAGESTRVIAEHMSVIGFDSFEGLPEDWREGFPKGMFSTDGQLPDPIDNAMYYVGLYQQTWPVMRAMVKQGNVGLIHIDCDLYSSTKIVLHAIGTHLQPGTIVVFDEWHGYAGCEQHEQRAWREWAEATGAAWEVLGHSFEQWAVRMR